MAQADSNNTVIPSTIARTDIGRRSFVAALAGGAALAAASVRPAAASDDAELVDLAKQMVELRKHYKLALQFSIECSQQYERIKPEYPKTLLWRMTDPVGYSQRPMFKEGGKNYLWCNARDIEKLRGKIQHQWAFIGTPEQAVELGVADLRDDDLPVKGAEHLWNRWVDKRRQKRALQLIKVYDEYKAAKKAAENACGVRAADDAADAIMDKMDAVYDRMTELTASTLEGFRAQAIGLVLNPWSGQIENPQYQQDFMLARMMSTLSGIPINPEEEANA